MRLKIQKPGDLPQMRETWQLCTTHLQILLPTSILNLAIYIVLSGQNITK